MKPLISKHFPARGNSSMVSSADQGLLEESSKSSLPKHAFVARDLPEFHTGFDLV
jgi:hypothetical protein